MAKWLEISADYRCNNRCEGCFSVNDAGPSMSTREAIDTLREGRRQGYRWFWFGGGEPTMRRDVFAIVAAAHELGYSRIKLQTNGMMFAYPEFARRAFEAGISEVNFSLKGANKATHDRLTNTDGCWDLLLNGIENWKRYRKPMEGDILAYRSNMAELPDIVREFHARGLERFHVWLFSNVDSNRPELDAEVPRISEVVPHIVRAMELKLVDSYDFITSLHTPACTVPKSASNCLFFPAELDLLVANPGGHRFKLETSPIEGGLYTERCGQCVMRSRCNGLRRDYVRIHGDAEFQPLSEVRQPGVEIPPKLLDRPDHVTGAPPAQPDGATKSA